MDSRSDEELIARYRLAPASTESRHLLETLFRRHQSRVVAWCYRLTGDRTQAADLAQDVFAKAYTGLEAFRANAKFTTWLYVIARNCWHDALRAKRVRPLEVPDTELGDAELADGNAGLAALDARDARRILRQIMDDVLDETEKQVMALHYGHELRLDAITAMLGLTNASGAKAYIVSARRKLIPVVKRWNAQS